MDRPRIAIVLDNPQRDLAGLVLTAVALCQRGAECYLVPASLRARELWALAPDYVLLYNLRRGFDALVRQLGEAGVTVGALDTEGGAWPDLRHYTDLLLDDPGLRRQVRPLCAWGPRVARHLVTEGFFAPEQLVVTGCPRFDLFHPRWRGVLADPAAGGGDAAGPTVLVNTNFSEANPRFGGMEGVYRHLTEVFGWPRARVDELVALQQTALDGMLALVERLAADLPHARIVVRPHPFEATATYVERFAALPTVSVNLTGSVATQLQRAAVAIQRASTTVVETVLAGVPALSPTWLPAAGGMTVDESLGERCATYEALRDRVAGALAGRYALPDETRRSIDALVRDSFHDQDGDAHRRVADAVLAALPDRRRVDERRCRRFLHGLDAPRRPLDGAARRVRHALHLSPDWSFRRLADAPLAEWTRTDQAYDAAGTRAVADRVLRALRADAAGRAGGAGGAGGDAVRDVGVAQARDRDAYLDRFHGHAVALACHA